MYQNPMNDFYLRQAQPYQQTFNFPPQQPQIKANWVSSIEEAKASQIDFVSTNLFCDTANGKIYLKKIGDNGKPMFFTYVIEEEVNTDPLSEINARLTKIEKYLGMNYIIKKSFFIISFKSFFYIIHNIGEVKKMHSRGSGFM